MTDGLGNQTRYIRTEGGDIAAVIDPLVNVTRYRYDKAHRLMNIVQGTGTETVFAFVALSIQILIIPEKTLQKGRIMEKKIFRITKFKIAVIIVACIAMYIYTPKFSWNVRSARSNAEQYIEEQYKFKPKYISGGYSASLDASHYFMWFLDEKNGLEFEVEVDGGHRFFLKQIRQYVERDDYLEKLLIKKMGEEISPVVKKEWGDKTTVEVDGMAYYTWKTYQEPTLKNIEILYKKDYVINIQVQKAGTKQEESEKLFEIVKFLRANDYLPYRIGVDYTGTYIKGINIVNIDQISSANDILALMD